MSQIFHAGVGDAAEILELQKLAYQSEAIIYDDWSIPPLTQTLAEIETEFSATTFLKAYAADSIVGSVRASIFDGTCAVGRLIVHPNFQGQGLGTQLMLTVEAAFPAATRFELFTGSKSAGNIRLYERLGYKVFRTQPLSARVELVFMEKCLR